MMDPRDIDEAWGWIGLRAEFVMARNAFGNLLVRDKESAVWRVSPDLPNAEQVVPNMDAYHALMEDREFAADFGMEALIEKAETALGELPPGKVYGLKLPAFLGGAYDPSNFYVADAQGLILFAVDLARQINDAPDGTQIRLRIVE